VRARHAAARAGGDGRDETDGTGAAADGVDQTDGGDRIDGSDRAGGMDRTCCADVGDEARERRDFGEALSLLRGARGEARAAKALAVRRRTGCS
jgi:hypothetical protein